RLRRLEVRLPLALERGLLVRGEQTHPPQGGTLDIVSRTTTVPFELVEPGRPSARVGLLQQTLARPLPGVHKLLPAIEEAAAVAGPVLQFHHLCGVGARAGDRPELVLYPFRFVSTAAHPRRTFTPTQRHRGGHGSNRTRLDGLKERSLILAAETVDDIG